MGLIIKYKFCQDCGCKLAPFTDTTGLYNIVTNPNGYGVAGQSPEDPNSLATDITEATIEIFPPGYTTPILFLFDIENLVIKKMTRVDEFETSKVLYDATITPVYGSIPSVVFPFFEFNFDSILLFSDSTQGVLQDGTWTVNYTVTDTGISPAFTYEYSAENFFICQAKKCNDDAGIKYPKGEITKSQAIDIFLNFDSLLIAVGLKNKELVNQRIETMKSLCRACDCGCC